MHRVILSILAALVVGCGSDPPVGGVVTLDDQPLAHAIVTFKPAGETPGLGGSGRTGADGTFTIVPARDGPGLPAGGVQGHRQSAVAEGRFAARSQCAIGHHRPDRNEGHLLR